METTRANAHKPTAVREGRRIKHYLYRGVKIDRWVNERGSFIGNTTMYSTAGTKYDVDVVYTTGQRDTIRRDSLKGICSRIDYFLDGRFAMGTARFIADERGTLKAEVTA